MFEWDRELLEGITDESRAWREQPDHFWSKECGFEVTPRLVLQRFGTDCMRNGFYDGVWVSFVKKKILDNPGKNYVIPDVRFENEATVIKQLGGHVWQVKRGPDPVWFRMYKDLGMEPHDVHPSEWKWANIDFETTIYNDDTLEYLKDRVRDRLASIENFRVEVQSDN